MKSLIVITSVVLATVWAQTNEKPAVSLPVFGNHDTESLGKLQTEKEAQHEEGLGQKAQEQAVKTSVKFQEPNFYQHAFVPLSKIPVGEDAASMGAGDLENPFFGVNGTFGAFGGADSMIVNGYNAGRKNIPYIVSLQLIDKDTGVWYHICGGSLVAANKVLTAAHCVYFWYYYSLYNIELRCGLGWYNLRKDETNPHSLIVYITDILIHPRYDTETYANDIAILTLAECVTFTDHIQPIQPAPEDIELNYFYRCTLSGWGLTSGVKPELPHLLQTTETHVLAQQSCKHFWHPYARIKKSMICQLGWPDVTATCSGDTGGPMVCRGYLVGIVSWGHTLCLGCLPGVLVRVSHLNRWITANCKETCAEAY